MKLLIATHNNKKKVELQRILSPLGIEVVTAEDIGCKLRDVEETGTTFEENAKLKAVAGCEDSGIACIADDSGLCVDFLNGEPGVYSARYSGVHGDDEANIDKLLKNLENVPKEKRTARFVCAACCAFPKGKTIEAYPLESVTIVFSQKDTETADSAMTRFSWQTASRSAR